MSPQSITVAAAAIEQSYRRAGFGPAEAAAQARSFEARFVRVGDQTPELANFITSANALPDAQLAAIAEAISHDR